MRFGTVLFLTVLLVACAPTPAPQDPPAASGAQLSVGFERASFEQILARAEKGEHQFQFELGAMYHDGDGVERNYGEAIRWYTLSAEAGNHQAQFNLGMMYKNGEGTPVDLAKARTWLTRSSDNGDVKAANQLGVMAYTGEGMPEDFGKALQYFTKAAMGGLAEGQLNVGVIHIRGEGVPPDVVEGCAWLSVSRDGGWERAGSLLDQLNQKLTAEQARQCEERAAELKREIKKILGR